MCQSCEMLNINGTNCHETGCPDAWKDATRECAWCGCGFRPWLRNQKCCTDSCHASYLGQPEELFPACECCGEPTDPGERICASCEEALDDETLDCLDC